jgi:hypothetical protein
MIAQVFSFRWVCWSVPCMALLAFALDCSLDTDNLRPQRKPAARVYDHRDVAVNSPWTAQQREQSAQAWRDRQLHGPDRPLDIQAYYAASRERWQARGGGDYHLPVQSPQYSYEPANQDVMGNIHRILDNAQPYHRAYEARQRVEQPNPWTVTGMSPPQQVWSGVDQYVERTRQTHEAYRRQFR